MAIKARYEQSPKADELLSSHIDRLWHRLPKQSRARLETLAISAGTSKSHAHRELVGALELIAREEGAPEAEFEFARIYLGNAGVAEHVARRARGEHSSFESRKQSRLERTREQPVIAIDGEGITLEDGSHIYRYMAAVDSNGRLLGELDCPDGIRTIEALRFLSALPKTDEHGRRYAGIFGYGLGYDRTKWLEDMPNEYLYKLTHEVEEKVRYKRLSLQLLGTCLTIDDYHKPKGERRLLVWDIIKAFQCKFVEALKRWKIGDLKILAFLSEMKNKRGSFDEQGWAEVKTYCKVECELLATLVYTYIQAHVSAGIDLMGQFHGAGSTGGAFLCEVGAEKKLCVKEEAAIGCYASAFFGGRAEISRLGTIDGPFHVYDIASAYPKALYDMPCMRHGRWSLKSEKVDRALIRCKFACVRYEILPLEKVDPLVIKLAKQRMGDKYAAQLNRFLSVDPELMGIEDENDWDMYGRDHMGTSKLMGIGKSWPNRLEWGSLPYRTQKGSIVFAATSPGGWVWSIEYSAAKAHYPGVKAVQAWTFGTTRPCDCERPFARIGEWFEQRVKWGAEGCGLVIKLGLNSMYGKTAQTIGKNPKYACRVIAGLITANTRARILEAIGKAANRWNVVYVATDGIISRSPIALGDICETSSGAKGRLGQWEHSILSGAIHLIQPGFYFSLTDDKKVKTRGTPAEAIVARRQAIADKWVEAPMTDPQGLPQRSSFRGIKTSILPPTKDRPTYERKADYGRWSREEHQTAYVWYPKRSMVYPDYRLATWSLDPTIGLSLAYGKVKSPEVILQQEQDWIDADQPDWKDGGDAVEGDEVEGDRDF